MFQTFISRHNSNIFSDKLVLTSVTPASSAPVLQTRKATSSTLYFDSLTVNAGNGGFLHCIQMDTSVNAANQVVLKLCRLDTPIIFIEARINLCRFVVTGCAAKTSATVTFPSLNRISLFAFCFNIWLNGVAS